MGLDLIGVFVLKWEGNQKKGRDPTMNRGRKFFLPIAIFAGFVLFYIILLNSKGPLFNLGDIGEKFIVLPGIVLWLAVVEPLYCYSYGKEVRDDKLKILFVVYNILVQALIIPLMMRELDYTACGIHLLWVALWTVLPVIFRKKKKDENI